MKKLLVVIVTLSIVSCSPSYTRYGHRTRSGCPALAKGDTVRVHTLGSHTDFVLECDTTHNRYAAWNLKTGYLALIAKSNLKVIRNRKEY